MKRKGRSHVAGEIVELGGVRYAIVQESVLAKLCERAGVEFKPTQRGADRGVGLHAEGLDGQALARRLTLRRKRAGLTQAALARMAGIRVETLNRVERGRTTPDFSTIRKLVTAMGKAEVEMELEPAAAGATSKE
jgi:DNA-binding XRE family transcriptional regulator